MAANNMSRNDSATTDENGAEHRINYLANCHFPSRGRETIMLVNADGSLGIIDAKAVGGAVSVLPAGYFTTPQFIGTVTAQCLAGMGAYLGWVLPATSLTLINDDIGPSTNIYWAPTTWTMGASVGFLLMGRLSDLFGRKWMVLTTTILGILGCVLGGAAQNVSMLIVSGVFTGIAAAGQLSFGIILGELVPNKQRGPMITLALVASLPFTVFGPIMIRSFVEHTAPGWRWIYYIGVIVNGIALVLYLFLYHPPTFSQLHVGKSPAQHARELDWLGIVLYSLSCCLFVIGLSWGGTVYAWGSAHVLCTLLLGIILFATLLIYEGFVCRVQPLIPLRMFKNVGFDAYIATATIGSMIYYTMVVLWPYLIESVYSASSPEIGWQSSVVGGGLLLGQILAGLAISHIPRVKLQAIAASLIILIFMTALTSLSEDRWAHTIAFGVIAFTGVGYIENLALPGVTLLWSPQDIGLASGVLGSMRCIGGAIAHALFTSIFRNSLRDRLPGDIARAATEAGLPVASLPELLEAITASNFTGVIDFDTTASAAVEGALVDANVNAFRMVFYGFIPFTVILVLVSCLVPDMETYLTNNVARRLQHDRDPLDGDDGRLFA